MEVLKQLKQIYTNKNAAANHITLFSMVGLFILFLCKYTASWANMFYQKFFIAPPSNAVELWFYLFALMLIFVYLIGYGYKVVNISLNNSTLVLPEFNLEPFYVFVKMIPLFLFWSIYFIAAAILGLYIFSVYENVAFAYVYDAVLLCLIPFILMIFNLFAMNFKYDKRLFFLAILGKALDRTLGDVIFLSMQIFIIEAVLLACLMLALNVFKFVSGDLLSLSVKLFLVCIGVYFSVIVKYLYFVGLGKIAEEKLQN